MDGSLREHFDASCLPVRALIVAVYRISHPVLEGHARGPCRLRRMPRVRDLFTRSRDRGRRRIKRPLPRGMSLSELAAQVGMTPRGVRYYFERKLLAPPEFRGTATRYGREHLLGILA